MRCSKQTRTVAHSLPSKAAPSIKQARLVSHKATVFPLRLDVIFALRE
jgi:hypothetical protein